MEQRFIPTGVDAQSWIGFEQRIQERRFRALLDTAAAAIAEGDRTTALTALAEARELRPDAPELLPLTDHAEALTTGRPAVPSGRFFEMRAVSAVSLLLVGVTLLVGLDWIRAVPPEANAGGAPSVASSATPVADAAVDAAATRGEDGLVAPTDAAATLVSEAARIPAPIATVAPRVSERPPARLRPEPVPSRTATVVPRLDTPTRFEPVRAPVIPAGEVPDDYVAPQTRRPEPVNPVPQRSTLAGSSSIPNPAITGVPLVAGAPVAANVVRQPSPVAGMSAVAGAVVPSRADETRVAQVLNQYARAYGQLDASAARAVWPSVDERALARAFSGLASQDVSFENCDIDVRGTTANASCRGRASYVGKVGSRELRSEQRQWRFELKRDGEAWKIETAEARRVY